MRDANDKTRPKNRTLWNHNVLAYATGEANLQQRHETGYQMRSRPVMPLSPPGHRNKAIKEMPIPTLYSAVITIRIHHALVATMEVP